MNEMNPIYTRSLPIFGQAGVDKLKNSRVMILGIGGVGGGAAEAVARAGVGHIELVDGDVFSPTNLNRQLGALDSTLGQNKAEAMKNRVLKINPAAQCNAWGIFYSAETDDILPLAHCDYVIDAIDDLRAKVLLAQRCSQLGVHLISCMGTGNRIDPGMLEIGDIYSTNYCPLARRMRKELRKVGIDRLTVLWSREEPRHISAQENGFTVGSVSFVPPVAGMMMAGYVIRSIIGDAYE